MYKKHFAPRTTAVKESKLPPPQIVSAFSNQLKKNNSHVSHWRLREPLGGVKEQKARITNIILTVNNEKVALSNP